ncbi:hypothetical protein [Deinococcus alpinitundrae]|uniref:hypothetical protein n=1 Tax=Deinococcus alpinitundrae TaxID=468913 RepID=UPI00137A17AB|nr:hypothetical protein [Deinococcus alpinitundrae]
MVMDTARYKDRLIEIQSHLLAEEEPELSMIEIYVDGQLVNTTLFAGDVGHPQVYLRAGKTYIDRL